MRSVRRWAFTLIGGYLIFGIMIYFIQEQFIFLPSRLPSNYQYQFDIPFEEFFLEAEDGARLNALHFKSVHSRGVILYFHGNAGNLARWGEITMELTRKYDYDVVVMDYRTYGKSSGNLSEEALHNDGQLFYNYLLQRFNENEIILYGRSLGTGIASQLAARNNPQKVILETPYYSMLDIGQRRFPFLPVKWLLKYEFKSFKYVQDISCPIAIFHGTKDEIIPMDSGQRLYESIPGINKKFFKVEGGRHNNLSGFETYNTGIRELLESGSIE
ncbi:MAG: alpha/beta hydrolase [Flavobacteriaceae bacterium]